MPTFENAINLSGSAMAISYENKFLGENFANYSRVKKLNLKGHIDSRKANTDFDGVKESLTSFSEILASANDQTSVGFIINGINMGKGRILSIDFSEKNNPVRMGSYTADIEIYEEGSIADEIDGENTNLYPNLRTALESHKMHLLESFSENFSFDAGEDNTFNYSHSLSFKYIAGESNVDYIALAKSLAGAILSDVNFVPSQADIPFGEYAGLYDEAKYRASKHKYDESYDLVDLSFSFSKKLNFLPQGYITYTKTNNRSLTRDAEGFVSVTENGKIKSRTNDFSQAQLGLSTAIGDSYGACVTMISDFGLLDGSSTQAGLNTQYISLGKTLNRQENTIDYNIVYTNNPRVTAAGIHDYSISISEDYSEGTLSASENGSFRPHGIKSTTFDGTSSVYSIVNSEAHTRVTNAVANYLANYSETTSINPNDILKRTSFSIDYPRFGQKISYSCDYSINGKFLSSLDSSAHGLYSVECTTSDSSPRIMRKSYMVPNVGEFLQEGYQTEVGSRGISITAQKIRTANYLSNPPTLETQLAYLYNTALHEILRIPRHYPNNIIKEIWITGSTFDFDSSSGQITVKLDVSFTMVGYDNVGNTANHVLTKRIPGNYTSL
jgi:hypothetical protein